LSYETLKKGICVFSGAKKFFFETPLKLL